MALPTISHNTPAAGSISWTEFGIQYNGQSFIIPAGNTAHKFVWWLYGGGTSPSLQSGNAMPELGSDDMILFLNKAGIGVLVPTAELLDGSLIVGGSILAQAIGANEIQTSHLSANAVTADIIASNAVQTQHLSAGTITADKLSVGTVSDNMVVNGSFEDALSGTLVGWEINAMTNGTIQPVTGQSSSGSVSIQFAATNTSANLRLRQLPAQFIPVSAASSRKYYISVRAGASTATTSGHYMRVNWYTAAKTLISSSDIRSNGALSTTFTLYEGQATPPATAKYMGMEVIITNLNVATTAYIDEISAHEVTMAAQIGDGQITTAKLVAGSVTTDRVAAKAITTDKLVVSDFTNYATGGGFDTATDLNNWTLTNSTYLTINAGEAYSGTGCLQAAAYSALRSMLLKSNVPVVAGETYFMRLKFKSTSDWNGTGNSKLRIANQDGTPVTGIIFGSATTSWVEQTLEYTIPAGMSSMQVQIWFDHTVGTAWLDEVQIRRMNGGELIVDGAIYAAKIATDAVTSEKIIANAITGNKIAANAVVANHIAANAIYANHIVAGEILASHIDADAINGKTITGATVRTAASGARVVMDSSGLGAWDTAGTKYLTADANGISIDGTIATTGGTNWLGEDVIVKISDTASTSGGRNIAGVSFEKEGFNPTAFPAVYSDAGTDLMLTAANNQAFLSLANENSGGEAELQGQGINLFCNTGDVNIGKTYNTAGNLNVDKINGHKASKAIIVLNKTNTQVLTTANTWYDIGWNSVPYKNMMTHSTSTNNHQITIQYSGVYTVSFKAAVNQNTGQVSGAITVNGTQQANSLQRVGNNSGQYEKASSSQQFVFNAGDVITIQVSCGVSGALADQVNIASISSEVLF